MRKSLLEIRWPERYLGMTPSSSSSGFRRGLGGRDDSNLRWNLTDSAQERTQADDLRLGWGMTRESREGWAVQQKDGGGWADGRTWRSGPLHTALGTLEHANLTLPGRGRHNTAGVN